MLVCLSVSMHYIILWNMFNEQEDVQLRTLVHLIL